MLTAQILTKNNSKTIKQTIESIQPVVSRIVIGDFDSTDNTRDICKDLGTEWVNCQGMNRSQARNFIFELHEDDFQMAIEPWEVIVSGHDRLRKLKDNTMVSIFSNGSITKDVRIWNNGRWHNPVFERLDQDGLFSEIVLYSSGSADFNETMRLIDLWKKSSPTLARPYYYQACMLLSEGKYEEFAKVANHYLFIEKDKGMSVAMTRYYYALVQLLHYKKAKPALQNLNLCMCANPLMAEFWCLTGDVFYHLLKDYKKAIEFYENAMIMGSRRLSDSPWPMEISKYKDYPQKMIESCRKIIESTAVYGTKNPSSLAQKT